MPIRLANDQDREGIVHVHAKAFPDGENALIAQCAQDLLTSKTVPATLSVVAEESEQIVGHVAYSPLTSQYAPDLRAYLLAPLAVLPEKQKQRIGSRLIEWGKAHLYAQGAHLLFVYGDPDYYGRYGFDEITARNFHAPYPLEYPFGWQALELNPTPAHTQTTEWECVSALHKPELW